MSGLPPLHRSQPTGTELFAPKGLRRSAKSIYLSEYLPQRPETALGDREIEVLYPSPVPADTSSSSVGSTPSPITGFTPSPVSEVQTPPSTKLGGSTPSPELGKTKALGEVLQGSAAATPSPQQRSLFSPSPLDELSEMSSAAPASSQSGSIFSSSSYQTPLAGFRFAVPRSPTPGPNHVTPPGCRLGSLPSPKPPELEELNLLGPILGEDDSPLSPLSPVMAQKKKKPMNPRRDDLESVTPLQEHDWKTFVDPVTDRPDYRKWVLRGKIEYRGNSFALLSEIDRLTKNIRKAAYNGEAFSADLQLRKEYSARISHIENDVYDLHLSIMEMLKLEKGLFQIRDLPFRETCKLYQTLKKLYYTENRAVEFIQMIEKLTTEIRNKLNNGKTPLRELQQRADYVKYLRGFEPPKELRLKGLFERALDVILVLLISERPALAYRGAPTIQSDDLQQQLKRFKPKVTEQSASKEAPQ